MILMFFDRAESVEAHQSMFVRKLLDLTVT